MARKVTDWAGWRGWRAATWEALYGESGFYVRPDAVTPKGARTARARGAGPAAHFRTSVHASPLFASAVARLLCRVDEALGRPERLDFVDMAAGRGELVTGVLAALPADVAARTRAYAVELAARPEGLSPAITWLPEPPEAVTGLLFANEWLDNVPVEVAEVDAAGVTRLVLVGADGTERLGEPVSGPEAEWLARWWPLPPEEGLRAEIGLPRDTAWASAVARLRRGAAVAADYAHTRAARPPFGTLTGFREGHETTPVPDGSCDITAHVALDACAAAGTTVARRLDAEPDTPSPDADTRAGSLAAGGAEVKGARGEFRSRGHESGTCTHTKSLAAGHTEATGTRGEPHGGRHAGSAHARVDSPTPGGANTARTRAPDDAEQAGTGADSPEASRTEATGTRAERASQAGAASRARVLTQRGALRVLGVVGARPPLALASSDPAAYVRALARAGEAAELTAPGGLGDFGWLVQPVGIADPLAEEPG